MKIKIKDKEYDVLENEQTLLILAIQELTDEIKRLANK